jgi:hypothetical protein
MIFLLDCFSKPCGLGWNLFCTGRNSFKGFHNKLPYSAILPVLAKTIHTLPKNTPPPQKKKGKKCELVQYAPGRQIVTNCKGVGVLLQYGEQWPLPRRSVSLTTPHLYAHLSTLFGVFFTLFLRILSLLVFALNVQYLHHDIERSAISVTFSIYYKPFFCLVQETAAAYLLKIEVDVYTKHISLFL